MPRYSSITVHEEIVDGEKLRLLKFRDPFMATRRKHDATQALEEKHVISASSSSPSSSSPSSSSPSSSFFFFISFGSGRL